MNYRKRLFYLIPRDLVKKQSDIRCHFERSEESIGLLSPGVYSESNRRTPCNDDKARLKS